MEIPFLKKKNQQGGGGPAESIIRPSDNGENNELVMQIAEEIIDAHSRKDFKAFREALKAFVLMIKAEDEIEDKEIKDGK